MIFRAAEPLFFAYLRSQPQSPPQQKFRPVATVLLAITLLGGCNPSSATGLQPIPSVVQSALPLPQINADSWLVADFQSGWIIANSRANERMEPASMVKMMTSYLVFDALIKQWIKLDEQVLISTKAWKTGGSRMFVQTGKQVSVEQLLKGLIIQSGNDAAVALAEHVSGDEEKFALRMNQVAAQLGMRNTHFVNSSGLPHPRQVSSALDLTLLAQALIRDFPDYYRIYAEKEYTYNGIAQKNRNLLLWTDSSVDGIKTGYTKNAGYCLIVSAQRGELRWLVTVLGSSSEKRRAEQVQSLLDYAERAYQGKVVYRAGEEIHSLRLWKGRQATAPLSVNRDISILYPKGSENKLVGALDVPPSLQAPLAAEQTVGSIAVKFDGVTIYTASLQVAESYPLGERWSRWLDELKRWLFRAGFSV